MSIKYIIALLLSCLTCYATSITISQALSIGSVVEIGGTWDTNRIYGVVISLDGDTAGGDLGGGMYLLNIGWGYTGREPAMWRFDIKTDTGEFQPVETCPGGQHSFITTNPYPIVPDEFALWRITGYDAFDVEVVPSYITNGPLPP